MRIRQIYIPVPGGIAQMMGGDPRPAAIHSPALTAEEARGRLTNPSLTHDARKQLRKEAGYAWSA